MCLSLIFFYPDHSLVFNIKKIFFALFCLFATAGGYAQNRQPTINSADKLLVAGPMLGYAEHREVAVWAEVSKQADKVVLRYWKHGEPGNAQLQVCDPHNLKHDFNPIKFIVGGLDMATTYDYELLINGQKQNLNYPTSFKTKDLWEWRKPAPDFSFLLGSCAYVNDTAYDRPGKPYGQSMDIFEQMNQQPSDFMLWLGDNLYLREADYNSPYGIRYRYSHTRSQAQLQDFLASRPHFAIWDDHDFGPNDANCSYIYKDTTLKAFADYWPNPTFGQADNKGIYTKFSWADADFFLLDNRYHRTAEYLSVNENNQTAYLGEKQLTWLKNALKASRATFKFIVSGSQALNPNNTYECWRHYDREWNELINFLTDENISGVIFLSGDRHFTEITAYKPDKAKYTFYDITVSPLTSGAANLSNSNEKDNPYRIKDKLLAEQNFAKIAISGEQKQRTLTISTYNAKGKKQWEWELKAADIKP